MATSSNIINLLVFQLNTIPNIRVFNTFKYLDQINDFPTLCLNTSIDRTDHTESNTLSHYRLVTIRGYIYNENSISICDELIYDVENVINRITSVLVNSIRVESVTSDEGLYTPYGVIDIQLAIDFSYIITVIPQVDGTLFIITQNGNFIITQSGNFLIAN
jgi:hypothetical protein